MKPYSAYEIKIRILDRDKISSLELLKWVLEAVSIHCEVDFAEGEVLSFHENVLVTEDFEMAQS